VKRPVSNVNKRAKMFAVCAWMQIAVLHELRIPIFIGYLNQSKSMP
jgi:hypothetical protein